MNIIPADAYENAQRLWKVLKFNHGETFANMVVHELFDNNNYDIFDTEEIDISKEFSRYRRTRANGGQCGITQLTLPARFGSVKTQTKNVKRMSDIELEEPTVQEPLEPETDEADPNHKVRGIFG